MGTVNILPKSMGTVNILTKQIVNKGFFLGCHRHHWVVVLLNEVVLSPPIVEWKMKILFPLLIHIISIVCLFVCFLLLGVGGGGRGILSLGNKSLAMRIVESHIQNMRFFGRWVRVWAPLIIYLFRG
jgi:hypothetical protein